MPKREVKKSETLKSLMLPAGTMRAVHVFVPALQKRIEDKVVAPVWAVRSEKHNFEKMMLVREVRILGPASGVERFDSPLPGTKGRGVAPLMTDAAILVLFEGDAPQIVDTADNYEQPKALPPVFEKKPAKVWYTSKAGNRATYTVEERLPGGKVRLRGENKRGIVRFAVAEALTSPA